LHRKKKNLKLDIILLKLGPEISKTFHLNMLICAEILAHYT